MTSSPFPGSDEPCACGHADRDHDPDCQVPVGGLSGADVFCPCSTYRVEPVPGSKAEPAFLVARRQEMDDRWFPRWTAEARCKSAALYDGGEGPQRPGHLYADAYKDDISSTAALPESSTLDFMELMCSRCPVRVACLAHAYDTIDKVASIKAGVFGGVPGPYRERYTQEQAEAWFQDVARDRRWTVSDLDQGETMHA